MITTLILFIIILSITVLVHELGHYLFARLVGVHVYEFAIGMGPKIISKKGKDGINYSIRAIPLGGFVSLAGEEVDVDLKKHEGKNLQDKTMLQRFLVMFMGVGFNFIFAFLVLFAIGLAVGAPNMDPIISEATAGLPAAVAGVESGDKVLSINNQKVTYVDDIMLYLTVEDLSKPVSIKVEKQDQTIITYKIIPEKQKINDEEKYIVGISFNKVTKRGFFKSIEYGLKQEAALLKQMFVVLKSLFTGKMSMGQLSGPVGIYGVVGDMKKQGSVALFSLLALLSINVGIINLLPFPAFDGGRILFIIIERIKGKPISSKVENTVHSIGFILLMLLMLFVTFQDIINLFK